MLAVRAAEHAIGLLWSDQIPIIADDALTAGIYSDTLLELAQTPAPIMADVGPLFARAMRELDVWPPSKTEAAWRVCRYLVESVPAFPGSPRAAVARIAHLACSTHDVFPNTHPVTALDLCEFYGIDDEYAELTPEDVPMADVLRDREWSMRIVLNFRSRSAASNWLMRHPAEGRL
jgi:hypothetical protein